ncbi:MAG: DUF1657 domain-containing protein [Firmicutes bacterium]|jgi:hypothetical protein|nr:DUF1657 domain-containing protein [Bacillota bacterium]NLO66453.1 DUF1657 domain-containing protein [Bacillota bacterium]
MTTKTRIEEAVAGAHSLVGQLKACALDTDVPSVKAMYNEMAQQVEDIIPKLQGRLGHVEKEEPQFT